MAETVLMHGLSFDGTGEIEEQEVDVSNVHAYMVQGWTAGPKPVVESGEPEVEEAPKKRVKKG